MAILHVTRKRFIRLTGQPIIQTPWILLGVTGKKFLVNRFALFSYTELNCMKNFNNNLCTVILQVYLHFSNEQELEQE